MHIFMHVYMSMCMCMHINTQLVEVSWICSLPGKHSVRKRTSVAPRPRSTQLKLLCSLYGFWEGPVARNPSGLQGFIKINLVHRGIWVLSSREIRGPVHGWLSQRFAGWTA